MDTKEVLMAITGSVSIIALVVAIISLVMSVRHNAIVRGFAAAGPELQLLGQINAARKDFEAVLHELTKFKIEVGSKKLTKAEELERDRLEAEYNNAIEKLLCIYETACGLYVDKKVDTVRFKRYYAGEIRSLFEDSPEGIKKRLEGIGSKFKLMRKVYEEWHNPDK